MDQKFSIVPSSEEKASYAGTKSTSSTFNKYWIWEIVLCIGSLAALLAVIVVLLEYDGQALPDWPYGITINSILSWITQLLTTCMIAVVAACLSQSKWIYFSKDERPLADMDMYDSASRGPLGCIAFLTPKRLGARNSATLGVVVTILSVGVGPFVQQMATVRNVSVASGVPASAPRTEGFSDITSDQGEPSQTMLAAIYGSLYAASDKSKSSSNRTLASATPDCPTGNCYIPPFQSLAVCSSCRDITHLLSRAEGIGQCLYQYEYNYTLPNGLYLRARDPPLNNSATIAAITSEDLPIQEDFGFNSFVNFTAIQIAHDDKLSNATAAQCSLYWCVNTYSVQVENNRAYETIHDTYYTKNALDTTYVRLPAAENQTTANYAVDSATTYSLGNWFDDKLTFNNSISQTICQTDGPLGVRSTEFLQPMLSSTIPDVFSALAAGMSATVRRANMTVLPLAGDDRWQFRSGVAQAQGTAKTMQTQVQVRWGWITLPALLFILTAAFLAMTAFESGAIRLRAWKMSTTPLLCSGLDRRIQEDLMASGDPQMAQRLAKGVRVTLANGQEIGDVWRLDTLQTAVH
ncbi:hypothetical protein BDV26DRAFT_289701 [Aspergillus bertholletiae]|uniref:Uncharacterized protein n=1 Tax=Aspergillus bertholletiae TaxID=1226010 RepID=A0A5N7BHG0_9EURO|nr:hypothetical protein BDV26DRAFT_289701 [Aspergillus bertholletiae]